MYSPKRRGEPMTLTTHIVEGIGGPKALAAFFRKVQRNLDYQTGLYTNYTLIFPTGAEDWSDNMATLCPDGNWRYGSVNCTQLKNSRILEMQAKWNRRLKESVNPTISYLDQYTCPPLWRHTDYDHRVDGAGKFSAALRVLGVSALAESEQYGGPVLSEGITQWMLAGVIDSYGQPGNPDEDSLLDFQLRKLHLLNNDCGFFLGMVASKKPADMERALSSTIAFGHIGHLHGCYGYAPPKKVDIHILRSWYMIQQLQQYYATLPADAIEYRHGDRMVSISEAIPAGAVKNNQTRVRYENGLVVYVNRNEKENWTVTLNDRQYLLPPNGFVAELPGAIIEYAALADGRAVDYVHGPQYTFCNGNGKPYDFGAVACANSYAIRFEDNALSVIPAPFVTAERIALNLKALAPALAKADAIRAEALTADGMPAGMAEAERAPDGTLTLNVTDQAFKYRITAR